MSEPANARLGPFGPDVNGMRTDNARQVAEIARLNGLLQAAQRVVDAARQWHQEEWSGWNADRIYNSRYSTTDEIKRDDTALVLIDALTAFDAGGSPQNGEFRIGGEGMNLCQHGVMAALCQVCPRDKTIAELRAEIERLRTPDGDVMEIGDKAMTDPKWTPGPWRKSTFPENWETGGPEDDSSSAFFVEGKNAQAIATVYGPYPLEQFHIANSNLIVAAPELYKALHEMVETYWMGSEDSDDEHAPIMVKAALAALAKARGETS